MQFYLKLGLRFALIFVFLSIILAVYVKYIQATNIFFPSKNVDSNPADRAMPFQAISLKTADLETLQAWFIPQASAETTILFLHGNGGNISHRLDKIEMLRAAIAANVFIVDYRGYGQSSGSPSEKGLYIDAFSAYNYLVNQRRINPENIIFYGESLGAAVAIDLASKVVAGGIIVEGAFSGGKDMGRVMYPFIPSFFIPDVFNSAAKIKNVTCPKLFIHSRHDEIVPFSLGQRLYEAADDPKTLFTAAGGHNSLFSDDPSVVKALASFVKEIMSK